MTAKIIDTVQILHFRTAEQIDIKLYNISTEQYNNLSVHI